MPLTPDTYTTVDEAVDVIKVAAANTEAPGRSAIRRGWEHLIAMRSDVCRDLLASGLRAYRDDERWVRHMIRETRRRAPDRVSSLPGLDRPSTD